MKGWNKTDESKEIKIRLNQLTETPIGKILVEPSKYYIQDYYATDIQVTKYPREAMMEQFVGSLKIQQMDEDASLIQVTMEDQSTERAADVLTTLIDVYNDVYLQDKNKIAQSTADFIKDRLAIIEGIALLNQILKI